MYQKGEISILEQKVSNFIHNKHNMYEYVFSITYIP